MMWQATDREETKIYITTCLSLDMPEVEENNAEYNPGL